MNQEIENNNNNVINNQTLIPRDAKTIVNILKSMGITKYEPRVVDQLMEFMYRYTTDVLIESKSYQKYAKKENLDAEDVRLTIQTRINTSFAKPPAREVKKHNKKKKN